MDPSYRFITPHDEAQVAQFVLERVSQFSAARADPLYHYTTGENLIRIVESGKLWATHIGCLNDSKELVYAVEELHSRVKARLAANLSAPLRKMLFRLSHYLADPGAEIAPMFVSCFSETADDLSQWRAYSGGEGGYALTFDPQALAASVNDGHTFFVRVLYEHARHASLLDDVLSASEHFFENCEGKSKAPNEDEWIEEFLRFWLWNLVFFAPCLKHEAFASERECRLIRYLQSDDFQYLQFRQRYSTITRHLPLNPKPKLPLSGVVVGPCRHPRLSQVGVGDLLRSKGYDPDVHKVTTSRVPYRLV